MRFNSVLLIAAAFAAAPATAATIENGAGTRLLTISSADPLGQSFLAPGAALESIGLQFSTLNPAQPAAAITISILQGAGLSGTVLGTQTFTPLTLPGRNDPAVWTDFDFTGITLTSGSAYTIRVEGDGSRNALYFGPNLNNPPFGSTFGPDAYTDGMAYFTGSAGGCGTNPVSCDLNFRVTTSALAAIPEPTTWAMLIAGFGLVGGAMRRTRSAKPAIA